MVMTASLPAAAAELMVVSAGALEPALAAAADGFRRQTGNAVRVEFATATVIRERKSGSLAAEILAGPDDLIEEFATAGQVRRDTVDLGKIGIGVAVHSGAAVSDVSTPEKLRAVLLSAKTVVYNRAASGRGVESIVSQLGIAEQIASKTVRFPDAEAVMAHLIAGRTDEVGFGAPTAISLYTGKNLKFVGMLPAELQKWTYYRAAATSAATPLAAAFLAYLTTPEAATLMKKAGMQAR
jgi:molybdate transport system substrate-binding protein